MKKIFFTLVLMFSQLSQARFESEYQDNISSLSSAVEFYEQTGVSISYASSDFEDYWGTVSKIDRNSAEKKALKIIKMLNRIDRNFIKNVSIVIVGKIKKAGAYAAGNTIIIDDSEIDYALYHELTHTLDHSYASTQDFDQWQRLNPDGFEYLGYDATNSQADKAWSEYKNHFVTEYGLFELLEDRAEIGMYIFEGDLNKIARIKSKYPTLKSKFEMMESLFERIKNNQTNQSPYLPYSR